MATSGMFPATPDQRRGDRPMRAADPGADRLLADRPAPAATRPGDVAPARPARHRPAGTATAPPRPFRGGCPANLDRSRRGVQSVRRTGWQRVARALCRADPCTTASAWPNRFLERTTNRGQKAMTRTEVKVSRRRLLEGGAALGGALALPGYLKAQPRTVRSASCSPSPAPSPSRAPTGGSVPKRPSKRSTMPAASSHWAAARLEMVFGDARSTPEGGTAEVERLAAEGVSAVVGGYASPICLRRARRPPATTCPTLSTSASPTRSSSAG